MSLHEHCTLHQNHFLNSLNNLNFINLNKIMYTFFFTTLIEAYFYRHLIKYDFEKNVHIILECIDVNEKQFTNTNHMNKYPATVD